MVHGMNVDTGQKSWLTPPRIINALGTFSLDPCCPPKMPWRTATRMVCRPDDGLAVDWTGKRVWLNPPYGRESIPFLRKMCGQVEDGGGVALLFGRTDTKAWHELVFPYAKAIMFIQGRIKFHHADGSVEGSANAPSSLVAYSEYDAYMLYQAVTTGKIKGTIARPWFCQT